VTQTLQLEKAAARKIDAPRLLVEWPSPWQEFVDSIEPALARSEARLAGEAPFGLVPYRILIPSYIVELFLVLAIVAIQVKIQEMRPYVAPRLSSHDVVYYSGDELPRTEDLGGAEAGATGRAGGKEAHHRTQTIKIARGHSLVSKVVDAPNLKLPASSAAVANLLAVSPNPGPPPSEGMRSNRAAPHLTTPVLAPAPTVARDYTRNGIKLDSVIPPAPNVARDPFSAAPNISANVIPPAPTVSSEHRLVAPALGPAVIPPAPSVSQDRTSRGPTLSTSVVAPAPSVSRDRFRSAPSQTAVIPPAPGAVTRELSTSPVQMANVAVVPPPVSAPERASTRDPKLALPSQSVIAPPPSTDVSRDMRRLPNGSTQDPGRAVVPPPPSQSGSGSFLSSLVGKIFGASDVVPPPPAVNSGNGRGGNPSLAPNVVQPPASVGATAAGGNPNGMRGGMGSAPGSNVIAPPPVSGAIGGTGNRSMANSSATRQGLPDVVPPPPSLSGPGGGTGNMGGGNGAPGGTQLANNVVPPPPAIGGGGPNSSGSGSGRRGIGLGGPSDSGAPTTAPGGGGSGNGAGAVISSEPGSKVGLPMTGGTGSLALSPSGGDKPGLGGTGGGTGIGRGDGPGSSVSGEGVGAGKTGAGRGSDPNAHGGISPSAGPGGAGNANGGSPRVPGVSVSGGSSVVTLPSFGSDPAANDPSGPGRSSTKTQPGFNVTVVATANSGGAFEPYKKLLHGETNTAYLDSYLGQVVMEFADEAASGHPFGSTLTAPVPIRDALPDGLPHARMVLTATLDLSGNLKNVRVLESASADMTAKIVAALRSWKFQPAMRGNQPVEVTVIIGFNISTDDRF